MLRIESTAGASFPIWEYSDRINTDASRSQKHENINLPFHEPQSNQYA